MSKYGLDLNKIKNNFKQYQQKAYKSSKASAAKERQQMASRKPDVWAGGNPNFDERTGTYKNNPKKFKTDYAKDLTKYMNRGNNVSNNTSTSENNNFNQNAGNKENMATDIGDYNDIRYSNIGNDYSVNIAGIGDGFSNMQGAAAYTALNNNQHARSSSQLNGIKRAAQASEQASAKTGAKDRAANLYNSLGYSQNYWRQKADAQQNFYLGDIFAMKAPEFQVPESPSDPMDGDTTQDTLKEFKDGLD